MNPSERVKGFAVGLSMAGLTAATSVGPQAAQAAQRACTGACATCFTCGIWGVPLLFWFAIKSEKAKRVSSLKRYLRH
jgi:hypothetical protein